ncbi:unnamed protein product [Arctogadus glacialis]
MCTSDSDSPQPVDSQAPVAAPQPITSSATESSASDGAMFGGGMFGGGRRLLRPVPPPGATEDPPRPGGGPSEPPKTAGPAPNAPPRAAGGRPEKDDISAGLASLMGRGRTKEHRPRPRNQDRRDDAPQPGDAPQTDDADPEPEGGAPKEEEEEGAEPAAAAPPETTTTTKTPDPPAAAPKSEPPLSPPTTPAPGFLSGLRPDPLAPPPGFIPAAPRPHPLGPPAGFIPAPPRPNPLARPPGFVPVARTDPLAPPPGFIPKPRNFSVKKPVEVKAAPGSSVAPGGPLSPGGAPPPVASAPNDQVAPPLTPSAHNDQAPGLVPTEEDHKRVKKIFSFNAPNPRPVLDPVALLTAAHAAAKQAQGKTEEQLAAEQAWYLTDKVWLVHKDGFSLATLLKTEAGSLPEGKVKVRLDSDGSLLEVDEDDVEKANPPHLDRVEDLGSLRSLNESSVIHTLRQRYGGNLAHTHAGPHMVVLNPVSTPAMYSEKVMHMFKGCRREDTAPHIYAMAQTAYRSLLTTRQDQSVVLLGKSGSGKTTNAQHLVQYLVTIAGSPSRTFSAEKWQAVYTALEAFGHASTSLNPNASRFTHVVALDFDQAGQVTSASIQTMLLEKTRVTRRPEGEATFNVFYYLLAGVDSSMRTELHLNHFAENHAFGIAPHQKAEDKQRAAQQFSKLQAALKVLGVSGEEQKAFWLVLGAIYHLGAAGATKAGRRQFARHEWAQKAAYLLGCSLEDLASAIFKHPARGPPPRAGAPRPENIELSLEGLEPSTSLSVAMVDQASSQALVRTLRTDEARGLLWLLEEEAQRPGATEETLLERLFSYYGPGEKGPPVLLRSERPHHFLLGHSHGTDWVEYDARRWLSHARTNPAAANAATLLQESQKKNIRSLFLSRPVGAAALSGSIAGLDGASQLSLRRASSIRKTFTSGVAAIKKKSLCIQIKLQVDTLLDLVRRSRVHFVHCLLPRADALRAGAGGGAAGGGGAEGEAEDASSLMQLDVTLIRAQLRGSKLLDALRIHRQGYPDNLVFAEFRRRFDVLAPHLTKKLGRNFIVKDEKRAVEELLEALDLEKSSYHMGLSRLFFRAGSLSRLEEQRDEQTRRNLTLFQAACCGYLARRAFKKRKSPGDWLLLHHLTHQSDPPPPSLGSHDVARSQLLRLSGGVFDVTVATAQRRTAGAFVLHPAPPPSLLFQQDLAIALRAEESSRRDETKSGEPDSSQSRRLEELLNPDAPHPLFMSPLAGGMGDLLPTAPPRVNITFVEGEERENQLKRVELQQQRAGWRRCGERRGTSDEADGRAGGPGAASVRIKYFGRCGRRVHHERDCIRSLREGLDTSSRAEDACGSVERLADLQTDQQELQRSVQQLRKKSQRLGGELQDSQLHLEAQQARNHQLEKKQRRFDGELSTAQTEVQRERGLKEKLARDKDLMTGEILNLRQKIQDKEAELSEVSAAQKLLEVELGDLTSQESRDEASQSRAKKQLRDLEAKVKDQEEELDEQAGTIQMLEQAKLRLEMEMQRQRQSHSKDMDSKDEEVEEIRQTCSKKLKQLEIQLEEEYEDKQKVLRERRELDTKLISAQDQASLRNVEGEKKLRKDLKRTKVLLADAQIMLDHLKSNAPSKREITQLKNQLEESEFTAAAAVKARKGMEMEIEDLHIQTDDVIKAKMALEEQISRIQREKNDLQTRMEEDQEDLNELMKKHKAAVSQSARDLGQISDLQAQLEESTKEKQEIQEKLHSLQSQLEFQVQSMVEKSLVSRQEAKIRELDTKLEYERTQIKRLESLVSRLKENLEKMAEERTQTSTAENREKEQNKRMQRQLRDIKEEMGELSKKETEASRKKHELEMDIESLEAANQSLQVDLKLAFKRIGDLQAAIEDDMETDDNDDLVNSLQDMVTKYQKRKSKTDPLEWRRGG